MFSSSSKSYRSLKQICNHRNVSYRRIAIKLKTYPKLCAPTHFHAVKSRHLHKKTHLSFTDTVFTIKLQKYFHSFNFSSLPPFPNTFQRNKHGWLNWRDIQTTGWLHFAHWQLEAVNRKVNLCLWIMLLLKKIIPN